MPLSVGIVGLPNVGKSTTFNALTEAQHAQVANYPFCTIEPNKAIVPVPDARLERLAEISRPASVVHATVEFVDIAGLVRGASKGEGLGNQFLGHIRETSAIVHIVRCFEDENIVHVSGAVDPVGDIEVINTELVLADLQTLDKAAVRLEKTARGDRKFEPVVAASQALRAHLDGGRPAALFPGREETAFAELEREIHLITMKPVIYVANVDENGLAGDSDYVRAVRTYAAGHNAEVVVLCAKFEQDMAGMSETERHEFLSDIGVAESGLEQVIHKGYAALGLISFFTAGGKKEARAWTVRRGALAPEAAGAIHSDLQRGFIRAEVISYQDFIDCNGEAGAKSAGKMRVEGKEYEVQDGDVVYFRFSV